MKKILLLAALFVVFYGSGKAQVFYSGFETWTDSHTPANWIGTATNITLTDVNQYSTSAQEGMYSMQIINDTTEHKRVSTTAVSVTNGTVYNITYYARGTGDVRTCIYKGVAGKYGAYSSYATINGTTWTKVTQTLISDTTSATAEFVLSVRNTTSANDHLQIDSFYVTTGTSANVSIHDIQYTTADSSDFYGLPVNTGGVVSAVKSGAYWIQNGSGPWSGVYVYDNVHTPALGDSLTFSAIVDEYYGLTELKSIGNYVVVNTGNTVEVTSLNIPDGQLEMYEGVLAKYTNVACMALPNTYNEWQIGDGIDVLTVDDLIYAYTPTLSTVYDVTGVMDYGYSTRKVQPRFAADVTLHNAIAENSIDANVFPNPSSDLIHVSANLIGTLQIADMTGRIVFNEEFNNNADVNVSLLETGVYTIILNGNNGEQAFSKLFVE